jgi:hypothetical protein
MGATVEGGDDVVTDWRSAFRDAARPASDPHADFEFFDPFGGGVAPPGRMRSLVRLLDGTTGTIEAATALIADAVALREVEEVNVYYPGWFPDADFGVIAIAGRSAKPWGIIKFRRARPSAWAPPTTSRGAEGWVPKGRRS